MRVMGYSLVEYRPEIIVELNEQPLQELSPLISILDGESSSGGF
jgi:hypothetical protein